MPDAIEPMSDTQRLIRIQTVVENIADDTKDHEMRIRRLEKILWIGIGFAAATGSAIGSFMGQIKIGAN